MRPPFHIRFVKDCGYCKDLGEACKRLRNKPWAIKAADRTSGKGDE